MYDNNYTPSAVSLMEFLRFEGASIGLLAALSEGEERIAQELFAISNPEQRKNLTEILRRRGMVRG